MSPRIPVPAAPFDGVPRFRSTALPPGGVMIRGINFPRWRVPASFAPREAKADALREGRLL